MAWLLQWTQDSSGQWTLQHEWVSTRPPPNRGLRPQARAQGQNSASSDLRCMALTAWGQPYGPALVSACSSHPAPAPPSLGDSPAGTTPAPHSLPQSYDPTFPCRRPLGNSTAAECVPARKLSEMQQGVAQMPSESGPGEEGALAQNSPSALKSSSEQGSLQQAHAVMASSDASVTLLTLDLHTCRSDLLNQGCHETIPVALQLCQPGQQGMKL